MQSGSEHSPNNPTTFLCGLILLYTLNKGHVTEKYFIKLASAKNSSICLFDKFIFFICFTCYLKIGETRHYLLLETISKCLYTLYQTTYN